TMEPGYTWRWRGSFTIVEDDCCCIVRPSYNALARTGHNQVTVFLRSEQGWRRSDFDIAQKCYTEEEVHLALARAGFAEVATYDAGSDLDMPGEFGRSFFVARKLP